MTSTYLLTYRLLKLFMTPTNSLVWVSSERSALLADTGLKTDPFRKTDHIDCPMNASPESECCLRI